MPESGIDGSKGANLRMKTVIKRPPCVCIWNPFAVRASLLYAPRRTVEFRRPGREQQPSSRHRRRGKCRWSKSNFASRRWRRRNLDFAGGGSRQFRRVTLRRQNNRTIYPQSKTKRLLVSLKICRCQNIYNIISTTYT